MSFSVLLPSGAIDTAILNATDSGRNGKGCILVGTSGNYRPYGPPINTVNYPANHDRVIAVGSIDGNGYRWDKSHYGEKLDILAPGEYILTTDLTGNAGYNKANGTAGD